MSKHKGTLEVLFNSKARVKILKFFFRNFGSGFNAQEISSRIQEPISVVNQEISKLLEIGLIKHKR